MPRLSPTYLTSLRKRNGLTQAELAFLLGLSPSGLSRFENRLRCPTSDLILGVEVVFGTCVREVLPAVYGETEDAVIANAKDLFARIEAKHRPEDAKKLEFLREMIERSVAHDPTLWKR
jgi:transcriptional regulator with XRE-family HTH domain